MPDGRQHPADLPVAAFMEHQLHDAGARLRAAPDAPRAGRCGSNAVIQDQAARKPLQRGIVRRPLHRRQIDFSDALRRMRHPVHEVPIVRKKQQALRIGIQPSHRDQADTG